MRRELADWMTPVDKAILEVLYNRGHPLVLTPALIADNSDWGRDTVREHMKPLKDHGLVVYHHKGRGVYRLSELGIGYLEGDVDVDEL